MICQRSVLLKANAKPLISSATREQFSSSKKIFINSPILIQKWTEDKIQRESQRTTSERKPDTINTKKAERSVQQTFQSLTKKRINFLFFSQGAHAPTKTTLPYSPEPAKSPSKEIVTRNLYKHNLRTPRFSFL